MAAREPTVLENLRELGRYVDGSLKPSQNEIPDIIAGILYKDVIGDHVAEARADGQGDTQIMADVAHLIAPPDPDAGATIVQGVPPEAHAQVLSELAALKDQIAEIRSSQAQPGPGITGAGQLSPEQQELQELREMVQSLAAERATANATTATVESIPPENTPEGGPAPEPVQP